MCWSLKVQLFPSGLDPGETQLGAADTWQPGLHRSTAALAVKTKPWDWVCWCLSDKTLQMLDSRQDKQQCRQIHTPVSLAGATVLTSV